ncbi:MAG TPA: DUF2934 domain-containing protein [Stellaceae bacterium]|jgi:hypothetical protein|nr:DUF2934 domain-containing protein [Stellaceae bacterium]
MMLDQYVEIAKRAYAIWEVEGRPSGRDLDHWLRAEAELQGSSLHAASADFNAAPAQTMPTAPAKPRRPARKRATRRTD